LILYAIPTPLGASPEQSLPAPALHTVRGLNDFVVENAKSARAFLGALGVPVRDLNIRTIDEDLRRLLQPLREKRPLGLLSEAGWLLGSRASASPSAATFRENRKIEKEEFASSRRARAGNAKPRSSSRPLTATRRSSPHCSRHARRPRGCASRRT
jgi:hypothetical protein